MSQLNECLFYVKSDKNQNSGMNKIRDQVRQAN